jgi:hypothetical protein
MKKLHWQNTVTIFEPFGTIFHFGIIFQKSYMFLATTRNGREFYWWLVFKSLWIRMDPTNCVVGIGTQFHINDHNVGAIISKCESMLTFILHSSTNYINNMSCFDLSHWNAHANLGWVKNYSTLNRNYKIIDFFFWLFIPSTFFLSYLFAYLHKQVGVSFLLR